MFDLISIGTVGVDMYFKSDSLTFSQGRFQLAAGGKYFTDEFHTSLGGGGANVAIGAQKKGARTALMSVIGKNAFQKMIEEKLRDSGVSTLYCRHDEDYLNISSILLSDKGEKTVINYQTPHQNMFHSSKQLEGLLRTKAVYLGNLPDVSLTDKIKLARFIHHNNSELFLNLGVRDCRRRPEEILELVKYASVLIVNGYEFSDLVKKQYRFLNFRENMKKIYFPKLENLLLVVTDGKKGSYAYNDTQVCYQRIFPVEKVLDTTGAGDGYTAAFIASFIKHHDEQLAMEKGAQYAIKIIARVGAN
ncbi:carbohydrate kinase family protein [Candidatus Roizmanbacteria bacterium]|nr:carbohydrate kinase family protein [Candidatus Roizmanbacteria bacterium]